MYYDICPYYELIIGQLKVYLTISQSYELKFNIASSKKSSPCDRVLQGFTRKPVDRNPAIMSETMTSVFDLENETSDRKKRKISVTLNTINESMRDIQGEGVNQDDEVRQYKYILVWT